MPFQPKKKQHLITSYAHLLQYLTPFRLISWSSPIPIATDSFRQ